MIVMNASQSSKGSEGVPLSHGVSAISCSMFAFVIGALGIAHL